MPSIRNHISTTNEFKIAVCPPYDWAAMLSYLAGHGTVGVEAVVGWEYMRSASVGAHRGWFSATLDEDERNITIALSSGLVPVAAAIRQKAEHLFDTRADCAVIAGHLGDLALVHPGLRIAGAYDGLELAVRTILGQQVSVKAGNTMAGRVARRFGAALAADHSSKFSHDLPLEFLTPTADALAGAAVSDFTELGIIGKRGETIIALASAVAEGSIVLEPLADAGAAEATMRALKAIPGIGDWTVQYLAIRVMRLTDAFPAGDLALRKALDMRLARDREVLAAVEKWRPWRSYAAMHLWQSFADECGLKTV